MIDFDLSEHGRSRHDWVKSFRFFTIFW